jgi:CP family cyanate transporter-like MFS transporter
VSPRPVATLVALFLGAIALRPQIVGIGPLLPAIQESVNVSHAVVGLVATIPVLCMGLFAPPAAYLAARVGTRAGIAWALALIGVFGVARAVSPGAALLILLTWPVGIGMGLAGALAPVAVKERFSVRPAGPTGIYTTGIQVGSAVSAAVAVPLAGWYGGWRWSLAVFSLVTCALAGVWLVLTRHESAHERPAARPPRLPWRSGLAWLLVALFSLMASTYYGINAWLPDSYVERGWSTGRAGNLLAVLNLVAIPAALLIPWLSDRFWGRRLWLVATATSFLVGVTGFVLLPEAAYAWVLAVGLASGAMFALVMTLPLDIEHDARRVGALVGMMLGLGYSIAALSPILLGAVRDVTGTFAGSLWLLVGLCVLMLGSVVALPRPSSSAVAQEGRRTWIEPDP